MARISEKSPRYRSKEQIAGDIAFVLASDALTYAARCAVIDQAFWVWSEFEGKYEGCRLWSRKAMRSRKNGNIPVVHEHPVPKKVLRDMLFGMKNPNPRKVFRKMEKYCIGVVISKDEDMILNRKGLRSRMPEGWDGKDILARYTLAGISVIKRDWRCVRSAGTSIKETDLSAMPVSPQVLSNSRHAYSGIAG